MASIGFFIGAVALVGLLTASILRVLRRWNDRPLKLITACTLSLLVCVAVGGFGFADGGLPNFSEAFLRYAAPQLAVFGLIVFGWNRRSEAARELGPPPDNAMRVGSRSTFALAGFAVALSALWILVWQVVRPAQTASEIQAALFQAADQLKSKLPMTIDSETTLVDVRVDGTEFTYVYSLRGDLASSSAIQDGLEQRVCSSEMAVAIGAGVSYAFEYWTRNPDRYRIGRFRVARCP